MDKDQVQEQAQLLQQEVAYYAPRLSRAVPGFRAQFTPLLSTYTKPFLVKALRTGAAFRLGRDGQLVFNYSSFRLFHGPIDKLEAAGKIPAYEADVARRTAVEQLIVHELVHVSLGLISFFDVQVLKALAGTNALGEDDLQADVTAAKICARLEMFRAEEKGNENYATRVLQQLFVMGSYAAPAFGAPADKPHKRQRFLGLAMMAARLHLYLEGGGKLGIGEPPIDVPIYPLVDAGQGQVLLSIFNPQRSIWGNAAKVNQRLLKVTMDELDSAPFSVSTARAAMILKEIGRVTTPITGLARAV